MIERFNPKTAAQTLLLSTALIACSDKNEVDYLPTPNIPIQEASFSTPTFSPQESIPPIGLELKSLEEFNISGTNFSLLNYTDFEINPEVAEDMLNFYDWFFKEDVDIELLNSQGDMISPFQKRNSGEAVFQFAEIAFDQDPQPFTGRHISDEKYLALIEVLEENILLFDTKENFATLGFARAACESMLIINNNLSNNESHELNLLIQARSQLCHAVGIAVATSSLGLNYEEYKNLLITAGLTVEEASSIPQDLYDRMPKSGTILERSAIF